MTSHPVYSLFRAIGSLWFAAVLLMLLLLSMACATVFESMYSSQQALKTFYHSLWFEGLLVLACVNVTAAAIARFPWTTKHIGFLLAHLSIILTLGGALVTQRAAVRGQVGIQEGEQADSFLKENSDSLMLFDSSDGSRVALELPDRPFQRNSPAELANGPTLTKGATTIQIKRFLPDSVWEQQVLELDDPSAPPAVQVSLSPSGNDDPTWVIAGSRPARLGATTALFRTIDDPQALARLLSDPAPGKSKSVGELKIQFNGARFSIPVERCTEQPAPLGNTGYSIQVLRYLPHATVGGQGGITNLSDNPMNPAVETVITGEGVTERRVAFAKFPDFSHGKEQIEGLELVFEAHADTSSSGTPVEIIAGPGGELYVRFDAGDGATPPVKLEVGKPIDSRWPGQKLTVLRHLAHTQANWVLKEPPATRSAQTPGLLLNITASGNSQEMWLQKYSSRRAMVDGGPVELAYAETQVPLGFAIQLNDFTIGTYPGTGRPRSFESSVTTIAPGGHKQEMRISMNHPAEIAGYTLYQSSYREQPGGPSISFLSVARDPGQPIVFAGYICMIAGMLWVLGKRIVERRRINAVRAGVAL